MSTRAELLDGALFEGFEAWCTSVVNAIITHYRVSDPCTNMTHRQPGEILSDPDDDKIYHVGGASGYPCDEVLQETRSADVTPIFTSVDLGSNNVTTDNKALAYLTADQENITTATWTKVLLNTTAYNPGSHFSTGNSKFTTPCAGYYSLVGSVFWVGGAVVADKTWWTGIYVNGSLYVVAVGHSSHVGSIAANAATIAYIGNGIDIELYCYHNAGVNTPDVAGGSVWETFLAVHLLSID